MRRGYRDYLQGLLQPRDRNKTLTGLPSGSAVPSTARSSSSRSAVLPGEHDGPRRSCPTPARRRPPPPRRYPARPARRHAAAPQPRVRARSAEPPHHHCSAPPAGDHDPASAADPGVGDTPTATKRLHPIGAGRVSQEPKPLSTKYSARRSTRFQRRPVDRYKPLTRAFVEWSHGCDHVARCSTTSGPSACGYVAG